MKHREGNPSCGWDFAGTAALLQGVLVAIPPGEWAVKTSYGCLIAKCLLEPLMKKGNNDVRPNNVGTR